jgi:transposase InsO family protein
VIERCIRTLENECTRRLIIIPYRLRAFRQELALYSSWYNEHRPHTWLGGATPDEVYHRRRPASRFPRFEPRLRWPRRSRCAAPQTLVRGQPGVALELEVCQHAGRGHLPIVSLKRVA